MDLQNITLGRLFGTVAHMVYAREGTYLVQLNSDIVNKLRDNYEAASLFFADVDRTFSALHEEFVKKSREPYKVYCRRWLRVARTSGFRIKLFKGNKVPRIKFSCMCDLLKSGKAFVPEVNVPSQLERVLTSK